jgi:hypothetical protein
MNPLHGGAKNVSSPPGGISLRFNTCGTEARFHLPGA